MTATLRIVLDQLVTETDAELAMASRELARALVATTPSGCEISAIAPAGDVDVAAIVRGLAEVRRTALARRELAAAWQLGVAPSVGGGMIHSASLMAPLVKHDRVHDSDQTVVTIWDLSPWDVAASAAAASMPRGHLSKKSVAWHKAMLKRAEKHADAVVVPTHAQAARLGEISSLDTRIRVIAGAAPTGFAVPGDAIGRRRTLGLPDGVIVVVGPDGFEAAFGAVGQDGIDLPVVVLDAAEGDEPALADLAAAAGIPESRLHVRGRLDDGDRAAVLDAAIAVVAPSRRPVFPWRVVEALALGVPVVAVASAVHREVVVDGGIVVGDPGEDAAALADGLTRALASGASLDRLAVMSTDRGRAFSWRESALRVWELHADL